MRKLHFDYYMRMNYSEPVSICHFTIKCIPQNTLRQQISNVQIGLEPVNGYTEGQDSFQNRQIYGCVEGAHDMFSFHITGDAETGIGNYEQEEPMDSGILIFRHPYGLNKPGSGLRAYFQSLNLDREMSAYEKSMFLMHRLYQDFTYQKNCTNVDTTAEQAWELGRGVCQDYAHIFISLLHMAGIPARYITGMLIGEGASHAWVEAYCDGCWYGLDPTNDVAVADSHIRIGVGRDASDCQINRGIMRGGGIQTQTIQVTVTDI